MTFSGVGLEDGIGPQFTGKNKVTVGYYLAEFTR